LLGRFLWVLIASFVSAFVSAFLNSRRGAFQSVGFAGRAFHRPARPAHPPGSGYNDRFSANPGASPRPP
jgi:hypothetical protein